MTNENNKQDWPDGPWKDEPDHVDWVHGGIPCIINRSGSSGGLCGYVGVPPGHPWHGKHYDDVEDVSIHGGLTYSDKCQGSICHIPKPGEPDDVWWLGFDCGHWQDLSPAFMRMEEKLGFKLNREQTYRDLKTVTQYTEHLARQVIEAAST